MLNETFKDKITILGKDIQRGKTTWLELVVAKLHTRNTIQVPIIIERAMEDGPVLLFMGALHGDEINGVEIVRRIIRSKENKPIRGTVICIPVFNVFGFLNLSREFPDGRDLNRVFPGSENGSLASQFAHQFMKEIAPVVDYVVDFHTGGADRVNIAQTRCNVEDKKAFELAKAFGAPYILDSKYIPKSLRETLYKMGKTVLVYEGGKASRFDEEVIQYGVNGAMNIMRFLGMKEKTELIGNKAIVVRKAKWMRAPFSGMMHIKIKNGAYIKNRTVMGVITDPYGEFERKVIAPFDCYVVCVNTAPIVNRGDALFHISTEADVDINLK